MEDNYSVVSTLVEQVKYVTFGKVQYVNLDPPCDVRTSMRTCIYIYIHTQLFVCLRTYALHRISGFRPIYNQLDDQRRAQGPCVQRYQLQLCLHDAYRKLWTVFFKNVFENGI